MKPNLSSKQMLLDITSMRSHAKSLIEENRDYTKLLSFITEKDYYYDESLSLPSIKELAGLTGLSYDVVRKQLRKIYEDLVIKEDKKPFGFETVKYLFYIKGYYNNLIFEVESLPEIPRVGEGMSIPFFKAYLDSDFFYVENIRHVLEDNCQTVEIKLKTGSYNLFWHWRKDQAMEEDELDWKEFYKLSEYELKRKLLIKKNHH